MDVCFQGSLWGAFVVPFLGECSGCSGVVPAQGFQKSFFRPLSPQRTDVLGSKDEVTAFIAQPDPASHSIHLPVFAMIPVHLDDDWKREQHISDVNHEMDVGRNGWAGHVPKYTRGLLYVKATLLCP